VAGTTFTVASQLAAIQAESTTCTGSGGSSSSSGSTVDAGQTCTSAGQVVIVLLTNRADATCALAQSEEATGANVELASFDDLEIGVGTPTGTVVTGTYSVPAPNAGASGSVAVGQFGTTDASCHAGQQVQATSGTVTLTTLTATTVTGSYNLTFATQGTFSGSFDVDVCQLPSDGASGDGGPPQCK
jgi:hypothetical protein